MILAFFIPKPATSTRFYQVRMDEVLLANFHPESVAVFAGIRNKLSFDEKKKIIETITEKITIGKSDVEINLCYIPSSWELTPNRQHNVRDSLR